MWDKQHRGKHKHASRDSALVHVVRVFAKDRTRLRAYECQWTDERGVKGEEVHWHVGHVPGTGRRKREDGKA